MTGNVNASVMLGRAKGANPASMGGLFVGRKWIPAPRHSLVRLAGARMTIFLVLSLLTACSSTPDPNKPLKDKPDLCPQVAIVRELAKMTDYGQEKPSPLELVAEARLNSVSGTCEYRENGIDIAFDVSMSAARGPRLGGLHTSFPFFVAVLDEHDVIVNKESLTAEFNFASDNNITTKAENLHVFIPLSREQVQATGHQQRVLVGWQVKE